MSKAVQVMGDKAIARQMKKLPESMQRAAIRQTLRKAARVIVKQTKKEIPKGTGLKPSGHKRKHLRQTIKTTSVKWYRNSDTFAITIGPEKGAAPHAHLVHEGTKPRLATIKKPLSLNGRYFPAGTTFRQPGNKANPYLARAVEKTQKAVAEKMRSEMVEALEKQTLKLAAKK